MSASTDPGPLAAVLLASLAAPRDAGLRAALGGPADDALQAALRDHALAWARRATGGTQVLERATPADLPAALSGHPGPVVLLAPDVPALGAHHLTAILDDLSAGVLLSTAATGDGTPFLIALSSAAPDLLSLVDAPFQDLLTAAATQDRQLGMLRAERRLTTLGDAHALLADPLTPPDLRALLRGAA